METLTRMWIWGFAAGVFLMTAIEGLASVISGEGPLAWVQLIASLVVVGASVSLLFKARTAQTGSTDSR